MFCNKKIKILALFSFNSILSDLFVNIYLFVEIRKRLNLKSEKVFFLEGEQSFSVKNRILLEFYSVAEATIYRYIDD